MRDPILEIKQTRFHRTARDYFGTNYYPDKEKKMIHNLFYIFVVSLISGIAIGLILFGVK